MAPIPYIHLPDLPIGPITLHPFGLLVATGVLIGHSLAIRRAKQRGVDTVLFNSFITWMLLFGFMGGHMLDEIFYHPDELARRPWSIFMLWEGLSSFGGFTGGVIGVVLWKFFEMKELRTINLGIMMWTVSVPVRRRDEEGRKITLSIMPFCDLILSVFPVAWIFGRSGCSVVHDHPGARAAENALLAVGYPPAIHIDKYGPMELIWGSTARYDLGLLELMFTIVLAGLLALTWDKRLRTGTYIVVVTMAYAPVRFAMDYLRIRPDELNDRLPKADPRYAGLTPAQWACIALFGFGVFMAIYIRRFREDPMTQVLRKPEPAGLSATSGHASPDAPSGA